VKRGANVKEKKSEMLFPHQKTILRSRKVAEVEESAGPPEKKGGREKKEDFFWILSNKSRRIQWLIVAKNAK